MQIGHLKVGVEWPPFVIAEMSGNHNQSLARALQIVEAAAAAGAQAVKLQTYTADTMTLALSEGSFLIDDPQSPWRGSSLHELYRLAHTPWDWHRAIMERARELGLLCFSTPFDATAVEFLEELGVPAYKIASFENVDLHLIRKVAATRKPMIISTGMAALAEIDEAVRTARCAGCRDLVLLKCTSTYPASPENSNIRTIPHLRAVFGCEVGLSDHTMGIGVAATAVAHGATVIEKHLTLDRTSGGVDSSFSLEPAEFCALVRELRGAWQSRGAVTFGPTQAEMPSLAFRRSIHIVKDLRAGDQLDLENLRCIRPGGGLPPKMLEVLLGRKVNRDVRRGTPTRWDLVS